MKGGKCGAIFLRFTSNSERCTDRIALRAYWHGHGADLRRDAHRQFRPRRVHDGGNVRHLSAVSRSRAQSLLRLYRLGDVLFPSRLSVFPGPIETHPRPVRFHADPSHLWLLADSHRWKSVALLGLLSTDQTSAALPVNSAPEPDIS